jgi:type I restriction enzyme M protein
MNLFLHGVEDGKIGHGDTLSEPKFVDEKGKLKTFNVVLANPPYSIKTLDRTLFSNDPYGRNIWGVPPQGRADYAFFQHVAKSMDPINGRAAILFPHGVLFRQEEKELRTNLINSGQLEAVIGLGAGLFYNSPMEAVVVILRNGRTDSNKSRVLFINALELVSRERAVSFLNSSHQSEILSAYRKFANDYSLAIPLYVDKSEKTKSKSEPPLKEVLGHWYSKTELSENTLKDLISGLSDGNLL